MIGFDRVYILTTGVAVFDPDGTRIPAQARGANFQRVLEAMLAQLDRSCNRLSRLARRPDLDLALA